MENPIIPPSQLTEEQKEKIKAMYIHAFTQRAKTKQATEFERIGGFIGAFFWIFGKDFFRKEE